jgi:hypothetical protein
MIPQIFDPTQSRKLIQDTLAEFLADLGKLDQGEPRLVILSKPGLQLVMLGGDAKEKPALSFTPTADSRITPEQAREVLARHQAEHVNQHVPNKLPDKLPAAPPPVPTRPAPPTAPPAPAVLQKAPEPVPEPVPGTVEHATYRGWQVLLQKAHEPGGWRYWARKGAQGWQEQQVRTKPETIAEVRRRIDATITESESQCPAPPAPGSAEARAEAARGGSRYACFNCEKKTHKPLDVYPGPDYGFQLAEVYLCPTCRNTRRQQVTDAAVSRTRLNGSGAPASPGPRPTPQPVAQRPAPPAPARQEEEQPDSSEFGLPEVGAEDPIFSADMF